MSLYRSFESIFAVLMAILPRSRMVGLSKFGRKILVIMVHCFWKNFI